LLTIRRNSFLSNFSGFRESAVHFKTVVVGNSQQHFRYTMQHRCRIIVTIAYYSVIIYVRQMDYSCSVQRAMTWNIILLDGVPFKQTIGYYIYYYITVCYRRRVRLLVYTPKPNTNFARWGGVANRIISLMANDQPFFFNFAYTLNEYK